MNWLESLNAATAQIERALCGRVDIARVARAAGCSEFHLQRMFPYITGVSLSEYIRRRKMSQAAEELARTDARVVDVALRYGYESPTAFARAFRDIHGVSPREARKPGAALVAYPRLVFTLSVKGETPMDYKIIEHPAFRVVGFAAREDWNAQDGGQAAVEFWKRAEERVEEVLALQDGSGPEGLLGVQFSRAGAFDGYMACVASERSCPEGMVARVVEPATYAVFACEGAMPDAMSELWHRVACEWLPSSGYEWDGAADVERYLSVDMHAPASRSELWLPVRAKAHR